MGNNALGIHIGEGFASFTAMGKGGRAKGLSLPMPEAPRGPEGIDAWKQGLSAAIHQAVHDLGAKGAQTVISLGAEYCILKTVDVPVGSPEKAARLAAASGPALIPTAGVGARFALVRAATVAGEPSEAPSLLASCRPGVAEAVMEAARGVGLSTVSVQPWVACQLNSLWELDRSLVEQGGIAVIPGAAGGVATGIAILYGSPVVAATGTIDRTGQLVKLLRLAGDKSLSQTGFTMENREFSIGVPGLPGPAMAGACPASHGAALTALGRGAFGCSFLTDGGLPGSRRRMDKGLLMVGTAVLLLMASGWVWLRGYEADLAGQLGKARKDLRSLGKDVRELQVLQRERNSLAGLGKLLEEANLSKPPLAMALATVSKSAPASVRITGVTYDGRNGLVLTGTCGDDASLGGFIRALKDSGPFAGVDLLQSDWSEKSEGAVVFKAACVLNRVELL